MTAVPRERLWSCYWKRSAADRIDRINIENDRGRPRRVARCEHRAGATACDRSLGSGGEPSDVNVVGVGERRGGGLALALMGAGTTFWQCQARARNREQSRRPAAGSDRVRRRSCAGAGRRVCRARRSSPLDLRRSPPSAHAIGWETAEPNIVMDSDAGNIGAETWLEGSERTSGWCDARISGQWKRPYFRLIESSAGSGRPS